jgi:hypothetical protein
LAKWPASNAGPWWLAVSTPIRATWPAGFDDVENLSQIWAVAPALVKLALRDDRRSQKDKEPPWKRIAERPRWAM